MVGKLLCTEKERCFFDAINGKSTSHCEKLGIRNTSISFETFHSTHAS